MRSVDFKTLVLVGAAIRGFFEHPRPQSEDLKRFDDESVGECVFTLTLDHQFGRLNADFIVDGDDMCVDIRVTDSSMDEADISVDQRLFFRVRKEI